MDERNVISSCSWTPDKIWGLLTRRSQSVGSTAGWCSRGGKEKLTLACMMVQTLSLPRLTSGHVCLYRSMRPPPPPTWFYVSTFLSWRHNSVMKTLMPGCRRLQSPNYTVWTKKKKMNLGLGIGLKSPSPTQHIHLELTGYDRSSRGSHTWHGNWFSFASAARIPKSPLGLITFLLCVK